MERRYEAEGGADISKRFWCGSAERPGPRVDVTSGLAGKRLARTHDHRRLPPCHGPQMSPFPAVVGFASAGACTISDWAVLMTRVLAFDIEPVVHRLDERLLQT